MHQQNSSTSISKSSRRYYIESLKLFAWVSVFLVLADVLVNIVFAYPSNPNVRPNFLQQYFDYGRSMEGKLRRVVGPTDETSAPITEPGWLTPDLFEGAPAEAERGRELLIATYGGSFNERVSRVIQEKYDDDITVRSVSAPGGPLNWAYSAYQMDRGQHQADVAVLTLIAFTSATYTMGGKFQDSPSPYTRPIYFLESDEIRKVEPVIGTLPEMRQALLEDTKLWQEHIQTLKTYDPYYKSILFEESIFDSSSILRMLRRWYGKKFETEIRSQFYGPDGFKDTSETVQVMKALVKKFAETARQDGVLPVVYLANTRGWGHHLYELLAPSLEENSIPYVSSHTAVPVDNPRLFLGDGHYIPEKDEELADEIIRVVYEHLE